MSISAEKAKASWDLEIVLDYLEGKTVGSTLMYMLCSIPHRKRINALKRKLQRKSS